MQKQNTTTFHKIAGALFGVCILLSFLGTCSNLFKTAIDSEGFFSYFFSIILYGLFSTLFSFENIAFGILAYSMFAKPKSTLPIVGFGLLTFAHVLSIDTQQLQLFHYILKNQIENYSHQPFLSLLLCCIFPILAYASATLIATVSCTHILENYKKQVQKLFFVPAICMAISVILFGLAHILVTVQGDMP